MYKTRDVLLDNTFDEIESFKNLTERNAFFAILGLLATWDDESSVPYDHVVIRCAFGSINAEYYHFDRQRWVLQKHANFRIVWKNGKFQPAGVFRDYEEVSAFWGTGKGVHIAIPSDRMAEIDEEMNGDAMLAFGDLLFRSTLAKRTLVTEDFNGFRLTFYDPRFSARNPEVIRLQWDSAGNQFRVLDD